MNTELYMTIKEASDFLNRKPRQIYRYIDQGLLTKLKQLGRPVLLRSQVEALKTPKPVAQEQPV